MPKLLVERQGYVDAINGENTRQVVYDINKHA